LRKNKAEMENLEHDVLQQQELIESLAVSEASLRRKLERARSERAAFRMSAEKLQKDLERIKITAVAARAETSGRRSAVDRKALDITIEGADQALETVIRAAESADERHKKELRGMFMQMEWMQARFQREASLRADAAYAKKFLQLQLDVANAWYVPPGCTLNGSIYTNNLTAIRPSSANSRIFAPIFWATRKPLLYLVTQQLSTRPPQSLPSRLSSLWRVSLPVLAYRLTIGLSKRLCVANSWSRPKSSVR
jgi:hypothetical protein